jgi:hypothetical protein
MVRGTKQKFVSVFVCVNALRNFCLFRNGLRVKNIQNTNFKKWQYFKGGE